MATTGYPTAPPFWTAPGQPGPSAWAIPPAKTQGRRRWPWVLVGLAAVGVLASASVAVGLSASGHSTPGTTSVGTQGSQSTNLGALAEQYNGIATRYQTAGDTWKSQIGGPNMESASATFASVIEQSNEELQGLPWPASMHADVNVFSADLGALQGDVTSLGVQSMLTLPQWVSTASRDAAQARAASDRIILDLGQTPADNSAPSQSTPSESSSVAS